MRSGQKSDLERLRDSQAREMLLRFLQDIRVKRSEAKAAYLTPLQEYPQDIERPQVFFSYAWGEAEDMSFKALQGFLQQLQEDFEQAGVSVWFDLARMFGNIEEQMRYGVNDSNLILLMGTQLYADKIKIEPAKNVRKELDYSIERAKDIHACSLVPLVLEGKASKIFPDLGDKHVWQDASQWLNLKASLESVICDMPGYIKALTSLKPVGLLAGALGLHRMDNYPKYREGLKASYERSQALLLEQITKIYQTTEAGLKSKPFHYSVAPISFEALSFDLKTDRVGQGSFGTVYKGQWQGIPVAIKEIHGTVTAESDADLNNEAEVMARANSPWVVSLYGVSKAPGRAALVMELMPQGSLHQLLHNQKPLSWELRYRIATDIAHGLLTLHGKGIIHRDLKSDNVLLDDHLRAKLSDFGLSKIKTSSRSSSQRGSQSVGTESWMAPELFLDMKAIKKDPATGQRVMPKIIYTPQSDIYSYSMVLWEMATRKIPYQEMGLQSADIRDFVKAGEREDLPVASACPSSFVALIEGGWKQKPEARLNLSFMIEQLRGLSAGDKEEERKKQFRTLSNVLIFGNELKRLNRMVPRPLPSGQITEFLDLVAGGWQEKAEVMIEKTPALLKATGTLNDLAGRCSFKLAANRLDPEIARLGNNGVRTFNNITGFQYALWALDMHMAMMLKRYLDQHYPGEAALQASGVSTGRWVNTQGVHAGPHLQRLIDALQKYVDNYDPWTGEQCRTHWIKQVGGAQLLVPMHVLNEYCHPTRSFDPTPDFALTSELPRSRKSEIYDGNHWVKSDDAITVPVSSSKCLASDFGYYRHDPSEVGGARGWRGGWVWGSRAEGCGAREVVGPATDLRSLTSLLSNRSQQRDLLLTELSQEAGLERKLKVASIK